MIKNRFGRSEWAGAFGDLGVLIPFVVGYISITKMDPLGILIAFGVFLIAAGLYYRTPFPVQPMKIIGGAALTQATIITPNAIWSAGLFTGTFWLLIGLSGTLTYISKIVSKPIIRGIVFGLGISFMLNGLNMMRTDILIAAIALVATLLLLENRYIPAMFALLILGVAVTLIQNPNLGQELLSVRPHLRLPEFSLIMPTWNELATGIFILALPQIPLSLGNAVIAVTAENNRLFPERPVTEKQTAVFQGIMNILVPFYGGIPMCHGAGGMAAHVRFGARTGGAVVILGACLLVLGLLFSSSVLLLFSMIHLCVLGVMMFFAGLELAMSVHDADIERKDFFVLLITAGFSLWNVAAGLLVGLIVQEMIKRNLFKLW